MKSFVKFLKENLIGYPNSQHLYEMATIAKDVSFNKEHKSVQIHGTNSGDREMPHIHIYNYNDKVNFNFEISLIDIIVKDEINLIKMLDRKRGIKINNRNKCSWEGYSKLKYDFEDWLNSDKVEIPGDYKNNLQALIWWYNQESQSEAKNPLLQYIYDRGLKINKDYYYLFNEKDKENYKELFK